MHRFTQAVSAQIVVGRPPWEMNFLLFARECFRSTERQLVITNANVRGRGKNNLPQSMTPRHLYLMLEYLLRLAINVPLLNNSLFSHRITSNINS